MFEGVLRIGLSDFIKYNWIDSIITIIIIFFALKSSFKESNFEKHYPLTTFILLLLSIFYIYIDIRLLFALITFNETSFYNLYMNNWISWFFIIPMILVVFFIDTVFKKN